MTFFCGCGENIAFDVWPPGYFVLVIWVMFVTVKNRKQITQLEIKLKTTTTKNAFCVSKEHLKVHYLEAVCTVWRLLHLRGSHERRDLTAVLQGVWLPQVPV